MVEHITTVAYQGIDAVPVDVQIHISNGLPAFTIVGLPDKTVAESRERVRAAITSLGISLPAKKILINLAPADIFKEGSHFDVPIALGLLAALGVIAKDALSSFIAVGELSLDGALMRISGVLPAALRARAENKGIICPYDNGVEAAWAGDISVLAPKTLLHLLNHFKGHQLLSAPQVQPVAAVENGMDIAEVRGQDQAKRALEIVAAGGHNLLMSGPPGSGKSMLAACLPRLLPPMRSEEMLETSLIASVAGVIAEQSLSTSRPFRSPHHNSSQAAIVGGGKRALPGEISLAHLGVLFLDELPEFPRAVLEALRQPLETGCVSIARAQAHVTYPARFQLIAAMNPCRCGYLDDAARACNKAPQCGLDYQAKLSGPLLDRFDIFVDVPAVDTLSMFSPKQGESSTTIALRVEHARALQWQRYQSLGIQERTNAEISGDLLQEVATLDAECSAMIGEASRHMGLSMRGLTRVLRVARTIADLAQEKAIARIHLAEALSYRQRLTKYPNARRNSA